MKMYKYFIVLLAFLIQFVSVSAQVDENLKKDIKNTGYIHSPLPLDYSKSFELFGLQKKVLKSDLLCDMEDMSKWSHRGIGTLYQTSERSKEGKHSLRLTAPTTVDKFLDWGIGLGTSMATFEVGGKNWKNTIAFIFIFTLIVKELALFI